MKRILLLLLVLGSFVFTSTSSRFVQYAHAGLFDTITKDKDANKIKNLKGRDTRSTVKKHTGKAHSAYTRNVKQMKQKLNMAEQFCRGDRKNNSSCKRYLEGAKKRYDKIPAPYQSSPDVVQLKKQYDELANEGSKLAKETADRHKANEDYYKASFAYRKEISKISGLLWTLKKGKEKKVDTGTFDITKKAKEMTANFGTLEKLEKKFQGEYAAILKKNNLNHEGFTPEQAYDLVKNRVQYRDTYVKTVCEKAVTFSITQNQEHIKHLLRFKNLQYYHMDSLGTDFKKTYNTLFNEINAAYKHINATPPKWMHTKYTATKAEFERALKKVVASSKWSKGKYPYTTSAMKKSVAAYARKYKLTIVSIGMPGNKWTIVKNKLTGIPLYKTAKGAVLFKKRGESYYRMHTVTFKKQYNGNRYENISYGSVHDYIGPCRK